MASRWLGSVSLAALLGASLLFGMVTGTACSSGGGSGFSRAAGADGGGGDSGAVGTGTGAGPSVDASRSGSQEAAVLVPTDATVTNPGHVDAGTVTTAVCPAGLQCDVACSGGTTTTITGKVYDPAGNDALYDVEVYVPQTALQPIPSGVLTGANACSCGALFESGAVVATKTGVDGSFTLKNAPVGSSVPLVIQIGKWRRQVTIPVTACKANAQADRSLKLPSTLTDPNDSMPQIAISTGAFDTLECLMRRIGLPTSEYVAGAGGTGHVHIFSGGMPAGTADAGAHGGTGSGQAESPPMTGAPASWVSLWDSQADLMPYDIVLLSCEGDETYNSNAPALKAYLDVGGRAFASHYHYAWFAGSLSGENVPAPPSDWGSNLATWNHNSASLQLFASATVVQTLNGSTKPFQKGEALYEWLSSNGGLGVEGASAGDIPIFNPKGDVGAANKAQPWLTSGSNTDYMSFDTPVNAPPAPDGGAPAYCGRAVFADIHVGGDLHFAADTNPPPSGCASHALSPQEKALEFMLFDLSSCVVSDTVTVALDAGLPPPPQAK